MSKHLILIAAATATIAGAALATPAEARQRGGTVSVQGSAGGGYAKQRSVSRQPGSTSVSQGVQTNSGRGYDSTRSATWGDGTYSGGRTTTLNDGTSFSRDTTAVNNGDGTASYVSTRTGRDGTSTSVSGTVSRDPN